MSVLGRARTHLEWLEDEADLTMISVSDLGADDGVREDAVEVAARLHEIRDDLRALVAVAEALDGLRHRYYPTPCWCDVATGNPSTKGEHTPQCRDAQNALDALEDG